ncbi:MAG: esterase [Pelagibacteraceae bacterium]
MNFNDISQFFRPFIRIFNKPKKIENYSDLKKFIKEQSLWVSQVTLLGYLKTRMGTQYVKAFENKDLINSINLAKEQICIISFQDLNLCLLSYMKINNLTDLTKSSLQIHQEIIEETPLELSKEEIQKNINYFKQRILHIDWLNHFNNNPFNQSCNALFKWAPIADELKQLDEEIVLNSMALKWNNTVNDFKNLISF